LTTTPQRFVEGCTDITIKTKGQRAAMRYVIA
jgi:hypothetical protein